MLVSSLVDLEAEEGKISHCKPTVAAKRGPQTCSADQRRSTFVRPRLFPAPGSGGFLLARGGLWGRPGRLHPWDSR